MKNYFQRFSGLFVLVALGALAFVSSCDYDSEEDLFPQVVDPTDTTQVMDTASWSADIQPIISANCGSPNCHGSNRSPLLNTYQEVVNSIDRVEARALVEKTMPPSGPLSSTDSDLLQNWIDNGTPEN